MYTLMRQALDTKLTIIQSKIYEIQLDSENNVI